MEQAFRPSVVMALVDYLPVICFGIGSVFLLKLSYKRLKPTMFALMSAGCMLVFFGGFYKCTWKLLFAAFNYNIAAFSTSQFLFCAPGFLLIFIASLSMIKHRSDAAKGMAAGLAMEKYKIPLVAIMTLANLGYLICMIIIAIRAKVKICILLYILSILTMLSMGVFAGTLQTRGINWIEQMINFICQFSAMMGHIILYKRYVVLNQPKALQM